MGKKVSGMKAVSYKQDIDQWSEDGESNCWKSWTGEYWIYTTNVAVAQRIRRLKGIKEKESQRKPFYSLLLIPPNKIDRVIKIANLPPRKKRLKRK